MKEQFVTYEIALKLKELGFDEECLAIYYTDDPHKKLLFSIAEKYSSNPEVAKHQARDVIRQINFDKGWAIKAPLWQQVVDWLETKGYYINIRRVFRWNPLPVEFSGYSIHIGTENPEEELECNLYYVNHFYSTKYVAREQAILKAIELCQKK